MTFGGSYVRIVNIVPGITERRTDSYGHVCMGDFSGIGDPLMCLVGAKMLPGKISALSGGSHKGVWL